MYLRRQRSGGIYGKFEVIAFRGLVTDLQDVQSLVSSKQIPNHSIDNKQSGVAYKSNRQFEQQFHSLLQNLTSRHHQVVLILKTVLMEYYDIRVLTCMTLIMTSTSLTEIKA